MGDEAEKEAEAKRSVGLVGILAWLGMVLAVYVLSIGPVVRMYDKKMIPPNSDRFVDKFYAPLEWAYKETPLHKPRPAGNVVLFYGR